MNLERTGILLGLLFCLSESESWPRKKKSAWWIFTQLIFMVAFHQGLMNWIWFQVWIVFGAITRSSAALSLALHARGSCLWCSLLWLVKKSEVSLTKNIFAAVNLDPIFIEKRWTDGESWPNDFVEKVTRGDDLRCVGSRCPSMLALKRCKQCKTPNNACEDQGSITGGPDIFTKNLLAAILPVHHYIFKYYCLLYCLVLSMFFFF